VCAQFPFDITKRKSSKIDDVNIHRLLVHQISGKTVENDKSTKSTPMTPTAL